MSRRNQTDSPFILCVIPKGLFLPSILQGASSASLWNGLGVGGGGRKSNLFHPPPKHQVSLFPGETLSLPPSYIQQEEECGDRMFPSQSDGPNSVRIPHGGPFSSAMKGKEEGLGTWLRGTSLPCMNKALGLILLCFKQNTQEARKLIEHLTICTYYKNHVHGK